MANEKKNLKTEKELTVSGKKTVKSAETAAEAKKAVKKAMPKEEWWLFYESFLKKADSENAVKKQKLVLYGTPKNVKEAAAWTAYTDQGTMNFEGVSLDGCIDRGL